MVASKPGAKRGASVKRYQYKIWTGPTLAMGKTSALLGGGGIVGTAYVARKDKDDAEAAYAIVGAGISGGLSIGLIQFWSSPNDFESPVTGIEMFSGRVSVGEWSAGVGITYGQSSWTWISGPAANTSCVGDGLAVGLTAGVTTGTSVFNLQFLSIMTNSSAERVSRSVDAMERARKF